MNISQNPTGEDKKPVWSNDGRRAFLSNRNNIDDIFIWDGKSFKNGVPDTSTFTNIAKNPISNNSLVTWTNNGDVAFSGQISDDKNIQTYVWNGQNVTNISQNPDLYDGFPTWSKNGRWAFSKFWWSPKHSIYVQDADNHTIFTTNGEYPPAWSADGNLAFCVYSSKGWQLSVWDGKIITKVAEGGDISAQWFSGSSVFCSSG